VIITPTFTATFDTNFGANAPAARDAWNAAAQVFTSHFSDDITINITVDAVPGTNVFGQSSTALLSISYADLLATVGADAKTSNDQIAFGPGGSMAPCDPTNGVGTWWLTRSQAKALARIPDDLSEDGRTIFGAGHLFTFSGEVAPGTFDFRGIAAHEISEVMGRLGLSGGTIGTTVNSFSLIDNFSYTGPGSKALRGGPGASFSIDNGISLLKLFNDPTANGLDSRDWAPGTNDAFNQFSAPGVVNPVSAVDLQLLDVLGYDLPTPTLTIDPPSVSFGLVTVGDIADRTMTISNTGLADLVITVPAPTGKIFTWEPVSALTVGPGASFDVLVEFAPPGKGQAHGTLDVQSNGAGSVRHVSLVGTGKSGHVQ
jgi:Abnormal spindle-like microcephaly-assoc'd, ASPM-SPD-2-Hydin